MTQETTQQEQTNTPAADSAGEIERLKAELADSYTDMELVANLMLATIPDGLKALIPEDLGPAAKVKWFNKAKETGVFRTTVPETDTRKPGITPQQVNPSELPPIARMSYGYSK
ncbi:hypothetical protein [Methylomicrobium sp. Wu6]|uniref:hypothetical protein n=1 Tax=Methylomicrobium sp. Wu6 TaxID=3107928 RepID=UPI002DD6A9CE|nr:hypothetical protein [Methylomicrobium sp. Wu6]MEC4747723.1 hypothetical protein [Methylomicrobium sp. Wu6]